MQPPVLERSAPLTYDTGDDDDDYDPPMLQENVSHIDHHVPSDTEVEWRSFCGQLCAAHLSSRSWTTPESRSFSQDKRKK